MSLAIEGMDFHDAIIKNIDFNIFSKEISIDILTYASNESRVRSAASVKLINIKMISMFADIDVVSDNKSSGNINHISVDQKNGKIHIHLIEGIISVKYEGIDFHWI